MQENEYPLHHHLKPILLYLYSNGSPDDFTKEGIPKVSVVNQHYTDTATREEIKEMWQTLFNNLKSIIKYLYTNGHPDDFTKEGMPKVSVVNKHYTDTATREEIDEMWFELYSYSTSRN